MLQKELVMTYEEKNLLLRDLCARLPHGVKVSFFNEDSTHYSEPKTLIRIECINNLNYSRLEDEDGNTTIVEFVKPYLYPISSMTEEQKREYDKWKHEIPVCHYEYGDVVEEIELYDSPESFEYLIENHFDYRGLILMNLAIDATGLNIY